MDSPDAATVALRRQLRSQLGSLGVPLQVVAEDVVGEDDARIDWVAIEPGGRACLVLVDANGSGEVLLARGLAQRAWLQARIADWQQLAPQLAARPDLRPRLVLLAPDFSRVTRLAAREADPDGLRLCRFHWRPGPGGVAELALETLDPLPAPRPEAAAPSAPLASVFRSGLSERDFGGNGGGQAGA